MKNSNYLIPANSKRSMLILSLFNVTDLIIFGSGAGMTLLLMLSSLDMSSLKGALLVLTPLLACTFLVVPIPNQHNVRTLIKNVYKYFTGRRTYYWKGWCVKDGEENSEQKQ